MANHISDFDPITIWPACPIAELVLVANDVWKPPVRWYALTPTALDYLVVLPYIVLSYLCHPFVCSLTLCRLTVCVSYCASLIELLVFSQCVLLLCNAIA